MRGLNSEIKGRSNNSFNRSGISLNFIVSLSHDAVVSRPANSGVGRLPVLKPKEKKDEKTNDFVPDDNFAVCYKRCGSVPQ
jgi:hypothetical protein